jgi:hypothetical protein
MILKLLKQPCNRKLIAKEAPGVVATTRKNIFTIFGEVFKEQDRIKYEAVISLFIWTVFTYDAD